MKYTYKELSEEVDIWWKSLSDENQSRWYNDPSPTFEMWVLGQMKPNEIIDINFDKFTYEVVEKC